MSQKVVRIDAAVPNAAVKGNLTVTDALEPAHMPTVSCWDPTQEYVQRNQDGGKRV